MLWGEGEDGIVETYGGRLGRERNPRERSA